MEPQPRAYGMVSDYMPDLEPPPHQAVALGRQIVALDMASFRRADTSEVRVWGMMEGGRGTTWRALPGETRRPQSMADRHREEVTGDGLRMSCPRETE